MALVQNASQSKACAWLCTASSKGLRGGIYRFYAFRVVLSVRVRGAEESDISPSAWSGLEGACNLRERIRGDEEGAGAIIGICLELRCARVPPHPLCVRPCGGEGCV